MEGNKEIAVEELMNVFKSKKDLYKRLTIDSNNPTNNIVFVVQYHLPSIKLWPLHFIRDVFSGEKKVINLFEFQLF